MKWKIKYLQNENNKILKNKQYKNTFFNYNNKKKTITWKYLNLNLTWKTIFTYCSTQYYWKYFQHNLLNNNNTIKCN